MILRLYTIGVYGFDARSFFETLENAGVDLLVDVRRRRAVRGSRYAFANAKRLIERLEELGIAYRHELALAPDNETREIVYAADRAAGRKASERTELPQRYRAQFARRVLKRFDFAKLLERIEPYARPCLLCVEGNANACHRSMVAARLASAAGVKCVRHLFAGAD